MPPSERQPLLRSNTAAQHFGISLDDLKKVSYDREPEFLRRLGGIRKIAELLRVDPAVGLRSDERAASGEPFALRRRAFGKNVPHLLVLMTCRYCLLQAKRLSFPSLPKHLMTRFSVRHVPL
jgi:hypothetical protein